MQAIVTTIFGPDINTDDIIRADILQEEWEKEAFAQYAFDKFDMDFRNRCAGQPANVIVAGHNFGSGSSREQAVYAIKFNNVSFMIAQKDPKTGEAFPDIFYRNAVNNGLPLIALDSVDGFELGHAIKLDLENKVVINVSTGKKTQFKMPEADIGMLRSGGLIGLAKRDIRERLKSPCNG